MHHSSGPARTTLLALTLALPLALSACGGGNTKSPSSSEPSTVTIHWQDAVGINIAYLESSMSTSGPFDCSKFAGSYDLTVYDENNRAVAASTKVSALPGTFSDAQPYCKYAADLTVAKAQRYRAERVAVFNELNRTTGETVSYDYTDLSTISASGDVWSPLTQAK